MYESDAVVTDSVPFTFDRDPELYHQQTSYPGPTTALLGSACEVRRFLPVLGAHISQSIHFRQHRLAAEELHDQVG